MPPQCHVPICGKGNQTPVALTVPSSFKCNHAAVHVARGQYVSSLLKEVPSPSELEGVDARRCASAPRRSCECQLCAASEDRKQRHSSTTPLMRPQPAAVPTEADRKEGGGNASPVLSPVGCHGLLQNQT